MPYLSIRKDCMKGKKKSQVAFPTDNQKQDAFWVELVGIGKQRLLDSNIITHPEGNGQISYLPMEKAGQDHHRFR